MWAEKAIHEPFRGAFSVEDFATVSTKASVLDAMGRSSEADAVMDKALSLPNTSMFNMYIYGVHSCEHRAMIALSRSSNSISSAIPKRSSGPILA